MRFHGFSIVTHYFFENVRGLIFEPRTFGPGLRQRGFNCPVLITLENGRIARHCGSPVVAKLGGVFHRFLFPGKFFKR